MKEIYKIVAFVLGFLLVVLFIYTAYSGYRVATAEQASTMLRMKPLNRSNKQFNC